MVCETANETKRNYDAQKVKQLKMEGYPGCSILFHQCFTFPDRNLFQKQKELNMAGANLFVRQGIEKNLKNCITLVTPTFLAPRNI